MTKYIASIRSEYSSNVRSEGRLRHGDSLSSDDDKLDNTIFILWYNLHGKHKPSKRAKVIFNNTCK